MGLTLDLRKEVADGSNLEMARRPQTGRTGDEDLGDWHRKPKYMDVDIALG